MTRCLMLPAVAVFVSLIGACGQGPVGIRNIPVLMGTVAGSVRDVNGRPLSQVSIQIRTDPPDGFWNGIRIVETGPDGSFVTLVWVEGDRDRDVRGEVTLIQTRSLSGSWDTVRVNVPMFRIPPPRDTARVQIVVRPG